MFQTVHFECHQQRSFTLKMHQKRWWLGGAYSAPLDPLAGLGLLLRRRDNGEGLWTLTMLETD